MLPLNNSVNVKVDKINEDLSTYKNKLDEQIREQAAIYVRRCMEILTPGQFDVLVKHPKNLRGSNHLTSFEENVLEAISIDPQASESWAKYLKLCALWDEIE